MDIIYLRDLKIEAIIGIFDWEREIKQTISFDLDMASDIRQAAASDVIENTLDYKALSKRVISYVEASSFQLVETLAENVAAIILNEFNVHWVRVRLDKVGAIRGASGVGVIIERGVKEPLNR